MLVLEFNADEVFDESKSEFITIPGEKYEFEHSLVSISKWESANEKPFLAKDGKTTAETIDYIRCMCLDPNFPQELLKSITDDHVDQVRQYIDAKMTATWFNDPPGPTSNSHETITAEIIYYWMVSLSIPFECQYWHLNRLLTLVKVCNQKNQPQKKMSRQDLAARNRQLNAERRAKFGSAG